MSAIRAFIAIMPFILALPAQAAGLCPDRINVTGGSVADKPEGFTVWKNPNVYHWLNGLSIYDGHPRELASLIPDDPEKDEQVWTLQENNPRGYWLECWYGNTHLRLIKELPENTVRCSTFQAKEGNHSLQVHCRGKK